MFRVSVDVGGTFTDLVALDELSGSIFNIKVPSVPRNPEKGIIKALNKFLIEQSADSIRMVGHATTIATNALFGQVDLELSRTALITTRGFRDVIEIGRQKRAEVYNLFFERPKMLVKRRHRYEVDERVDHNGNIITDLNISQLKWALDQVEMERVETISVGFLNSYINPVHEEQALKIIRELFPGMPVSISSRISAGYREYERFSTAVVNSTLIPLIHRYLTQLSIDLNKIGITAPLYVMQSNGGLAKVNVVSEKPVTLVESGPASGVIASSWLGVKMGEPNIISFDMGGTTAKAGIILDSIPEVVPEYEVAGHVHMGRLLKGSGYPVRFPFIDLAECSAGGGTIVWTDDAGAINVGPTSAGAYPGPVCYGRGGDQTTITDANLLLGRLNPSNLIDGDMKIYPDLAKNALERLGSELDMSPEGAAVSVVRIANSMMSKILRIVSIERGLDPRNFSMVAFGGAGPMHACALAEELQIGKILIPLNPGMFSALGLLTADLYHDYSRAIVKMIGDVDPVVVKNLFSNMESEGVDLLIDEGVSMEDISFQRSVDLRYLGQSYELNVKISGSFNDLALESMVDAFHIRHDDIYGYSSSGDPVELVNVNVRVIGKISEPVLDRGRKRSGNSIGTRKVFFEGISSWVDTPVYERKHLGLDTRFSGPAIIEQYDATTVVYPNWEVYVDDYEVIRLRRDNQ